MRNVKFKKKNYSGASVRIILHVYSLKIKRVLDAIKAKFPVKIYAGNLFRQSTRLHGVQNF